MVVKHATNGVYGFYFAMINYQYRNNKDCQQAKFKTGFCQNHLDLLLYLQDEYSLIRHNLVLHLTVFVHKKLTPNMLKMYINIIGATKSDTASKPENYQY